jgi:hypothetical protein
MQISTILAGVLATVVSISAAPTIGLAKREIGGVCQPTMSLQTTGHMSNIRAQVLICHGANATGNCHYEVYSLEECHDLPAGLSANASTFAPDGDSFFCYPRV